MVNPTEQDMRDWFKETSALFKANSKDPSGKNHVYYGYFCGHGAMRNTSFIILNESDNNKRYYPWENNLFVLANKYENNAIAIHFDCCREEVSKEKMLAHSFENGIPMKKDTALCVAKGKDLVKQEGRGLGEEEEENYQPAAFRNIIFSFATQPSRTV